MTDFVSQRVVAIGEAMVELAPIGGADYRRSFAGDTFNTAWRMAQALAATKAQVGFASCLGQDALSERFAAMLQADGLDISTITRHPSRIMGLYMIELDGVERSFHYWRDRSAARCLADDPEHLRKALDGMGLIHLSGITLAILPPEGRETLYQSLHHARSAGSRISFDPNIRPRLWQGITEARRTLERFLPLCDILLPSFDDEAGLWGDHTPDDTIARYAAQGARDIVVKNGSGAVHYAAERKSGMIATPPASEICDTTGAGDAFNAGYLAARLMGRDVMAAIRAGQAMSSEVLRHYGALIPKERIPMMG